RPDLEHSPGALQVSDDERPASSSKRMRLVRRQRLGTQPASPQAMPRDGSIWNTCPARRHLDQAVYGMRGHAFIEYGSVLPYPAEQYPLAGARNPEPLLNRSDRR